MLIRRWWLPLSWPHCPHPLWCSTLPLHPQVTFPQHQLHFILNITPLNITPSNTDATTVLNKLKVTLSASLGGYLFWAARSQQQWEEKYILNLLMLVFPNWDWSNELFMFYLNPYWKEVLKYYHHSLIFVYMCAYPSPALTANCSALTLLPQLIFLFPVWVWLPSPCQPRQTVKVLFFLSSA